MCNLLLIPVGVILNVLCIRSVRILQRSVQNAPRKTYLLYLAGAPLGGVLSLLLDPVTLPDIVLCATLGGALGELLALFLLTARQACTEKTVVTYYDDGSPARFFITGDKHRHFDRVRAFCHDMNTRRKDVLIILGDAGFNYYGDDRDDALKKDISQLNITLFCLHGNKENRPQNVGSYGLRSFCGGHVLYEPRYPSILFAIDGETYTFEGRKYMVVGGAHSDDKMRCLEEGTPYWEDEMPNEDTRQRVERHLETEGNRIYGMLPHTCPIDYLPTEMFLSAKQCADARRKPRKDKDTAQFTPDIDRSTEIWLGAMEKRLDYTVWFCGHYHIDKPIDRIQMMYRDIRPLHMQLFGDASCLS